MSAISVLGRAMTKILLPFCLPTVVHYAVFFIDTLVLAPTRFGVY